jgi:hypothetical protein
MANLELCVLKILGTGITTPFYSGAGGVVTGLC